MRIFLLLLVLLILPACSFLHVGSGDGSGITLVNQTGEVVYYTAMELETSHRVDPIPTFSPTDSPFPKLAPGASVAVDEVTAYEPGDDVRFFLYAAREVECEGATETAATLVHLLTMTAEELSRHNGRVVVAAL